mgnify:CR=1 FL=1
MGKDVRLQVAEVKQQRDFGRGKARISSRTMEELGVSTGDVIEVRGKRTTSAVVWPAYPEDAGKTIIRIDGITRGNADVSINEFVTVKKVEAKDAQHITLAPVNVAIPGIDEGFHDFVRTRILETPLVEGDSIQVTIFGNPVYFTVMKTRPHGIVRVSPNTALQILSEPIPEKKGIAKVTYEDVGGLQEEIQRVREMVELPLRHPELFQRLGIEPPKGVLLHGPPGCGKTRLAQAVANESDANFFNINGPEIMSKFYGESEARLREVFQKAQESSPSILFIDELDAIAPKREEVTGEVERRVVAQLLALMDGLESRGNIVVIGATNRPNALDPALRRPGRFDREIEIGIPDKNGRYEILQIHTRGMPLAEDVNLVRLAEISHGYTGADIAALSREASMRALRRYLPEIDLEAERVPSEVLEKMEVRMEDFWNAYREITPTAMREVEVEVPTVHWDEIGGLEEVKQQLMEAIEWPLKKPEAFKRMGIKPPKGILLYGPPGCGKTLVARAVATESEANFISIKGPQVYSKWVGESEKAIREVFRKARLSSPSIVFFDELDSIIPARGFGYADSGVTERVISQLLTELDGIETLQNVVVIGATNRPDILDPAVLRPGRLDRLIYVNAPDEETRLQIFKLYTANMPLNMDVDLQYMAKITRGYSGADIETMCREAAMNSLRRSIEVDKVTMEDFKDILARIRPSITPEMETWYQNVVQARQKVGKPTTPVA